jgi:hypothetical protein
MPRFFHEVELLPVLLSQVLVLVCSLLDSGSPVCCGQQLPLPVVSAVVRVAHVVPCVVRTLVGLVGVVLQELLLPLIYPF